MTGRSGAARLVLAAAILAGASYLAADYLALPVWAGLAWKGAGVGLLAVYAALSARRLDGWLLAGVMAFGAAGDVLLGAIGFVAGGAAFFAGHLLAIGLYSRHQRPGLTPTDGVMAAVLVLGAVLGAWALPSDRAGAMAGAAYAVALGGMAATAWRSRFPRERVALGAMLFLASDLLIFARAGPLAGQGAWLGFAIWALYFAGQALVCVGVVRALGDEPAAQ